jgi:hypothetical protein
MDRPCGNCNRCKVGPWDSSQCRVCWRYHNDPTRREAWDGPGALKQAANFVTAAVQHVAAGLPTVSEEEYQARIAVCQTCPLYVGNRCTHKTCGCRVQGDWIAKARWKSQKCPLKKWTL